MTKRIYVSDTVHESLKREAALEGRTMQWLVDAKLTRPIADIPTINHYPPLGREGANTITPEPQVVLDSQEWQEPVPQTYSEPRPITIVNKSMEELFKNGSITKGTSSL